MEIKINCPHCGQRYAVERQYIGSTTACTVCGKDFTIYDPEPPEMKQLPPAPPSPPPPACIRCRACGGMVARIAEKCPHCGAAVPKPLGQQKVGGCAAIIIIIIAIIVALSLQKSDPVAEAERQREVEKYAVYDIAKRGLKQKFGDRYMHVDADEISYDLNGNQGVARGKVYTYDARNRRVGLKFTVHFHKYGKDQWMIDYTELE